jgi:hypothetical protein
MDGAAIVFPLAEGLKNMETISGAAGPAGDLEVSDAEGKSRLEKLQFFFIFCSWRRIKKTTSSTRIVMSLKKDLGQTLREVNEPPGKWEVYEHILRIPYPDYSDEDCRSGRQSRYRSGSAS